MTFFYRVEGTLAGVSAIGSLTIFITFLAFRETRRHPYTLVFWLSVCDFLFSLKYVVTALIPNSQELQNDPRACLVQAIASQFLGTASIGWNGVMSVYLMMSTINPFSDTRSKEKWFHAWVWLSALGTTLYLTLAKAYGPSIDGTCWLPKDVKAFDYIFMLPLLFYMALGIVSLIVGACRVNNLAQARSYKIKVIFRLMFYIVVFLACWLGVTIYEFYFMTASPDPQILEALRWWASLGIALSGLGNSIVWLTNPTIWSAFKKRLVKNLCGCIFPSLENIPLLPGLENVFLQDSDMDVTRLTEVLRKNVLTCILLGMRTSLRHLHSSKDKRHMSSYGTLGAVAPDEEAVRQAGGSWNQFEKLMEQRKMTVQMYESDMETDDDRADLEDLVILEHTDDADIEHGHNHVSLDQSSLLVTVDDDIAADASHIPSDDLASSLLAQDEDPIVQSDVSGSSSSSSSSSAASTPSRSTRSHRRPARHSKADNFMKSLFEADFKHIETLKLLPSQLEKATGENESLTRTLGLFSSSFIFRTMAPRVFYNLRVVAGVSERRYYDAMNPAVFLANAAETVRTSEGRSGSFFCFSPDRRFILKTIPEAEFNQLMKSLRYYYNHINYHRQSMLMRILGAHSIKLSNASSLYVIVMENMFSNTSTPIHEIYDLKGSWIDRGEPETLNSNAAPTTAESAKKVLFLPIQLVAGGLKTIGSALSGSDDSAAKRGIRIKKDNEVRQAFNIGASRIDPIMEQLYSDANLLASLNIMDYSLLVGIHHKVSGESESTSGRSTADSSESPASQSTESSSGSGEPSIETPGTNDKKMERFAKVYLRCKDADGISSVEPKYYARRFINSIQNILS